MTGFNLDRYLDRIGYDGPREASLQVLSDLHRLHPAAIPFENLNPLMGVRVSLEPAALQAKLVDGGRGGYCCEQNGLFKLALVALGFQVTGLAGRVLWGVDDGAPPRPRTHFALAVDLPQGRFLADVGFGGLVMTGPLRLEVGPAQITPHERFRLVAAPDDLLELQAEVAGAQGSLDWRTLYRFDMTPQFDADAEMMNWFTATHPGSIFTGGLSAARAQPHRRLALRDTRFTIRPLDGPQEQRTLGSLAELARVLTEEFGLTLPDGFERVGPKLGLV